MESASGVSTSIQVQAELPPNKPMSKTQAIMEKIKTIAKEALHWMAKNWDLILAGLAITAAIALAPIATVEAIVFLSTIVALVIINRLINYVSDCRIKRHIKEKEELINEIRANLEKMPNDAIEKMKAASTFEELSSSLNTVIDFIKELDKKTEYDFVNLYRYETLQNRIYALEGNPDPQDLIGHRDLAVEEVDAFIKEVGSQIEILKSYVKELKARLNK